MPLTKLQTHVLRVLATQRSPDSYIAGGIAINRNGPRFSNDIDIFQDSERRLETAALADAVAIFVGCVGEDVKVSSRQGCIWLYSEIMEEGY